MNSINAYEESYEAIEILGKEALFSNARSDRASLPEGIYGYDIRHTNDDQSVPGEIAPYIWVNHYGTVLINEELNLGEEQSILIDEDAVNFLGFACGLEDYLSKDEIGWEM